MSVRAHWSPSAGRAGALLVALFPRGGPIDPFLNGRRGKLTESRKVVVDDTILLAVRRPVHCPRQPRGHDGPLRLDRGRRAPWLPDPPATGTTATRNRF